MEKILVTGASGFIGGHVVKEAMARGLRVICFDRYSRASMLPDTFLGDIRDAEAINEAVQKVDYAINLAGILGTQETINRPIPSVYTNVIGAINFLEACRPTPFHQVRGVQIGVGNYWMNNSYSITKSTAMRFCQMYNKEHGTQVAMVQALNAYGPGQKHKPVRKIIPTFVVRALRGQDIKVYGDGEQVMDMIWVKDLARILVHAAVLEHGVYDRVFEAGTGRPTTVNWIAEQVIKVAGSQSRIVHVPMRPGEEKGAVVMGDPSTLAPLGGYELRPFEDAIQETVAWYREFYPWELWEGTV